MRRRRLVEGHAEYCGFAVCEFGNGHPCLSAVAFVVGTKVMFLNPRLMERSALRKGACK